MSESRPEFPFRFSCRRSGNCCARPEGIVEVTDADVTAIARHLGISEPGFRSRYLRADGRAPLDGLGNRCVFLAEGSHAACTIYPVRPERCRTWPFWPELLDSPQQLREAMLLCPGIEKTE